MIVVLGLCKARSNTCNNHDVILPFSYFTFSWATSLWCWCTYVTRAMHWHSPQSGGYNTHTLVLPVHQVDVLQVPYIYAKSKSGNVVFVCHVWWISLWCMQHRASTPYLLTTIYTIAVHHIQPVAKPTRHTPHPYDLHHTPYHYHLHLSSMPGVVLMTVLHVRLSIR